MRRLTSRPSGGQSARVCEDQTSLGAGLGGGAREEAGPGEEAGLPENVAVQDPRVALSGEVGGREEAWLIEWAGFHVPDLEGTGRGLRRPSHRLPVSEARRRRRRNSARAGRARCPAEVAAATSSRPGPWEPCATRVMRTEAEAAGQPLEPGQCLSKGLALTGGTEGDSALEPGWVWPRDLGQSAASAQPGACSES